MDFDALVAFLRALVRVPSPSGEEGAVIEVAQEEMHRLGFDQVIVDAYGNLIGVIEGKRPGPTLLLDAHCDTVGVAPGVPWQHDPFAGEIVGSACTAGGPRT